MACAIRHKADCIVSFDNGVGADIDDLDVPIHNLRHFRLPLLADVEATALKPRTRETGLLLLDENSVEWVDKER